MALEFEYFEPKTSEAVDDTVIVLFSEAGAPLDGYGGARAADVARITKHVVLAAARPYMDLSFSEARAIRPFIRAHQSEIHAQTAEEIAVESERYGATSLVLAGHSAGGYGSIGAASANILENVSLLYASDAPAIRDVRAAELRYLWYTLFHDKQSETASETNSQPRVERGAIEKAQYVINDLVAHAGHGSTEGTLAQLISVVLEQPDLPVVVDFPGNTFTAPLTVLHDIKQQVEGLSVLRSAGVEVNIFEDLYHGQLGDYVRFAGAIDRAIQTYIVE